jgi:lysophospholipase L1-like esterase
MSGYQEWKGTNKYSGKFFSILGDSISTLDGYNPEGYRVFYTKDICRQIQIQGIEDTWWGKVIDFFDGKLLVNDSWSGSRVTRLDYGMPLFPSGCSDERTRGLHVNDVKPDVIIVYMGTNDWGYGVRLQGKKNGLFSFFKSDETIFSTAYEKMLSKLKKNYPVAEIWCCTLCETFMSSKQSFEFPQSFGGIHIELYNQIIRDLSFRYGCKLIDLYSCHFPYDSIDGSHPNLEGMKILAKLMCHSIVDDCKGIRTWQ